MVCERVVADDWLVSINGNRYSVLCQLSGQTVQVVREADRWVTWHRRQVVAEHAALGGLAKLVMLPEHGPGAFTRNAHKRRSTPRVHEPQKPGRQVEMRDLAICEHLGNALSEAA